MIGLVFVAVGGTLLVAAILFFGGRDIEQLEAKYDADPDAWVEPREFF